MADAMDSKSIVGDNVWVQVPPSAPNKNNTNPDGKSEFVLFFTRDYLINTLFKIPIDNLPYPRSIILRARQTPITDAIINPLVQPVLSPRQCRCAIEVERSSSILILLE